ncbi:TIGR02391 family protein [Acetobacter syzygii]|uniref:TIGR02391 family protein n=1 Tax=Acetobacter syzygii TaxID=146476 RepID=UPI0039EAC688
MLTFPNEWRFEAPGDPLPSIVINQFDDLISKVASQGDPPMLAINSLQNENEKSEQRGFANLVRGLFGMFWNPAAHAPRVYWAMEREDAEDLLSMVSLVHRHLDKATMPRRA